MQDERDDDLQALFDGAGRELPPEDFTPFLMARLRRRRRLASLQMSGAVVLALALAVLFAGPLQEASLALSVYPLEWAAGLWTGFTASYLFLAPLLLVPAAGWAILRYRLLPRWPAP